MTDPTTVAPIVTQTADITSPIVTTDSQPVVASPIVEANPAPADVVDPAAPITDPAAANPDPAKPVTPDWAQKRINELTAKRHEESRRAQALEAEKTALATQNAELLKQLAVQRNPDGTFAAKPAEEPKPAVTQEEIDKLVKAEAARQVQVQRFNDTCNAVADTGKKEFTDWDEALKNLTLVGAIGANAPIDFLETAVELQNSHKVLHYLGTNLDEAEKISKLPPKRMALEMARLEATLNAPVAAPVVPPVPVSQAPAPVLPVTGSKANPANLEISDPSLTMEQFNALRNKQADERRNRYRRA